MSHDKFKELREHITSILKDGNPSVGNLSGNINSSPQVEKKEISDLPKKPGRYSIVIEGVRTMLPIVANFDGEKWTNLKKVTEPYCFMMEDRKMFYYAPVEDIEPTNNIKPKF